MTRKLIIGPRKLKPDAEFFKEINSISLRWFMTTVSDLPVSKKARLIPNVYHTIKTTVPQLARGFGIPREEISRLIDSSSR